MSNKNFLKFFDPELVKNMTGMNGFPFDFKAVMETQRKNFEALTQAQQLAFEGLQTVTQRQSELISQMLEDNTNLARQVMSEGTPEQKIAKQADLIRKNYEKSMANIREIGEIVSKSNQKASEVINKRVTASLSEVKSVLEQNTKTATKKAA